LLPVLLLLLLLLLLLYWNHGVNGTNEAYGSLHRKE
jgi:hypothetical protein